MQNPVRRLGYLKLASHAKSSQSTVNDIVDKNLIKAMWPQTSSSLFYSGAGKNCSYSLNRSAECLWLSTKLLLCAKAKEEEEEDNSTSLTYKKNAK